MAIVPSSLDSEKFSGASAITDGFLASYLNQIVAEIGLLGAPTATSIAVDYLALLSDTALFVDATGGAVTITLPTAVGNGGKIFYVSKRDPSVNAVILNGDGVETINGAATQTITSQYDAVTLISDGAEWGVF